MHRCKAFIHISETLWFILIYFASGPSPSQKHPPETHQADPSLFKKLNRQPLSGFSPTANLPNHQDFGVGLDWHVQWQSCHHCLLWLQPSSYAQMWARLSPQELSRPRFPCCRSCSSLSLLATSPALNEWMADPSWEGAFGFPHAASANIAACFKWMDSSTLSRVLSIAAGDPTRCPVAI